MQRDVRRGWKAAYHDYVTLPKIANFRLPQPLPPGPDVPLHLLTGKNDWQLAAWMLASWFDATGMDWKIVIHEDGTLPEEAKALFQKIFPNATLIEAAFADAQMMDVLSKYPLCRKYRFEHPLARKLFDVPHFTSSERFLLFDSDLLFFKRPVEILEWTSRQELDCWFNEDVNESSFVSREEAKARLGIDLWPKVNSGLCLLSKSSIDWDLCESCLRETSVLKGPVWRVEQTLFALCASRGRGGLLPAAYEVSLNAFSRPDSVARHYVGPVRNQFFSEGIARLAPQILNGRNLLP